MSPVSARSLWSEAELLALVADEVEHREHRLVARATQSAAELLKEDRGALGGPQEQHRVDVGRSRPSLKRSAAKRMLTRRCSQVVKCLSRARPAVSSPLTARAGMPASLNDLGHVLGVRDADAEAERSHRARVRDLVAELGEHDRGASVVAGVHVRELALVVAAAGPADAAQVRAVGDSEVVERAEQVGAERVPEPQLRCGAAAEERADVDAVGAFGCGREAEQFARGQVIEDAPVRRASAWWNSSITTISKASAGMFVDAVGRQRLNAREDVVPTLGPRTADVQLAEVASARTSRYVRSDCSRISRRCATNSRTAGRRRWRTGRGSPGPR